VNNQVKIKEEDFMEEFNPWNREVNLLEKVLNSHDSIMKEGKDDREVVSIANKVEVSKATKAKGEARKEKVGARKTEVKVSKAIGTRENEEEKVNQQRFKELVDKNTNLKHKDGDRSKKQNMD